MKVGILTFHRAMNYGAVWQCWALVQACSNLGHEAVVIDYSPVGIWRYKYFLRQRPDRLITSWRMLFHLNRFYRQLPRTIDYGENYDAIKKNPPICDAYIVGSDQMWSEKIVGKHLGSFLLDFAPKNVKRISYAVSQGGLFAQNPLFIEELRKFSAISRREPTWKAKMSSLTSMQVEDVCDPSLLMLGSDYAPLEQKVWFLPKRYIAVFDLTGEPLLEASAIKLSHEMHLPLVSMTGYKKWCDKNLYGISPKQWIYVLRHADFICTNSFHGTAFAINFRKPFVSVANTKAGNDVKDDRKSNILMQCGLMSQYIQQIDDLPQVISINYDEVEYKIEAYRRRSLNWLSNALM